MEDKRLIGALILFLMVPSLGLSQTSIEIFPESKIVSEEASSSTRNFELITGSVRRINSLLSPESVLIVTAEKQGKTLLGAKKRNTEEIFQYYLDQLKTNAEVIFKCSGRDCGPSSFWANRVYKKALLYGPEQYQRYIVAKVRAAKGNAFHSYYLLIYVGQRATGQVYIQHQTFFPEALDDQLQSPMAGNYRTVFPWKFDGKPGEKTNEKFIEQIENIVAGTESQYVLVVHDSMREGESFEQALSRTEEQALRLKEQFGDKGELINLHFHGAGPISPIRSEPPRRIELVELN